MLRDENFPLRDRICKSIYNARTMTSRRSDLRGGEDYDILPQLSGKYIHSRRDALITNSASTRGMLRESPRARTRGGWNISRSTRKR